MTPGEVCQDVASFWFFGGLANYLRFFVDGLCRYQGTSKYGTALTERISL